jgi:hypothetical protein
MFIVSCSECGATENDSVAIVKTDTKSRKTSPDTTISEDLRTTFYCENCDFEETVDTGVLPESKATHFESRRTPKEDQLSVRVDGHEVPYRDVDEQVAENAYYTTEGVRGTSEVHHVHVHLHAQNLPTFSKGKHRVEIGDYVDEKMILGNIRYHDECNRTLKFFQSLDDDVMEPLDRETGQTFGVKTEKF